MKEWTLACVSSRRPRVQLLGRELRAVVLALDQPEGAAGVLCWSPVYSPALVDPASTVWVWAPVRAVSQCRDFVLKPWGVSTGSLPGIMPKRGRRSIGSDVGMMQGTQPQRPDAAVEDELEKARKEKKRLKRAKKLALLATAAEAEAEAGASEEPSMVDDKAAKRAAKKAAKRAAKRAANEAAKRAANKAAKKAAKREKKLVASAAEVEAEPSMEDDKAAKRAAKKAGASAQKAATMPKRRQQGPMAEPQTTAALPPPPIAHPPTSWRWSTAARKYYEQGVRQGWMEKNPTIQDVATHFFRTGWVWDGSDKISAEFRAAVSERRRVDPQTLRRCTAMG
jgi:hypothetical protein